MRNYDIFIKSTYLNNGRKNAKCQNHIVKLEKIFILN